MLGQDNEKMPAETDTDAKARRSEMKQRKLMVCVGGKVFGINDIFGKERK